MKTLVIQSYRTRDVPDWIARCLTSVKAWAYARGYDHLMTDDRAFQLCGPDYLAKVGDNKQPITDLARLELIRIAHRDGYDRAIWVDADVFVFDPENLNLPPTERITFARETWIEPQGTQWICRPVQHNAFIICPAGDPDIGFIIEAVRHTARVHRVRSNNHLGVDLIRGLHNFLVFPLVQDVGLLSNHVLLAIARGDEAVMNYQARYHQTPIHAANLCASLNYSPSVPEADIRRVMDLLETTRGGVLNDRLPTSA
ncbi:MAG TPA: hypothetical protein VJP88_00115 [Caulobacteraceae bacterium]|nr:hypothetical protein [Caulobacteraceae bacterium]